MNSRLPISGLERPSRASRAICLPSAPNIWLFDKYSRREAKLDLALRRNRPQVTELSAWAPSTVEHRPRARAA
jgi:hypothetical protein